MYEDIELHLIVSDEFGEGFDPRIGIGSSKIILCTLSMLSSSALVKCNILEYVPMERLVVDEASQITEPCALIPLVKGARRAVMVGDL